MRGFDVKTGKRLWIFHTIPRRASSGYDTWLNDSAEYTGNTGVWAQIAVDEDLGIAYLPVEAPTGDYYGGHRPGQRPVRRDTGRGRSADRGAEVALPAGASRHVGHGHSVCADAGRHHGEWQPVKAVAQPTKQAFLYVFDRVTGKPIWPIEEEPVPQGRRSGEWYSPTQPIPTKPPAYGPRESVDDLIDFTPELHEEAMKLT